MIRFLFSVVFAIGAIAIIWIGSIFFAVDALGLAVTILIAAAYLVGFLELVKFRRATLSLNQALSSLSEPINELPDWLSNIDSSLRNSVRFRVEGQRNGLPAPVITPYLVGLLVMLGLLGTFIGMVDTLKGAVVALEGTNELEAIRAGLAAPIEGLGLAFGTSVAGVAASAMLGLLSTISRRERLQASQLLDSKIAEQLNHFTASYQQQLSIEAMQEQAKTLPTVVEQLGKLVSNLEKMGDQLGERLLENQNQFQNSITQRYQELGDSVDQSLKATLLESAQVTNEAIQPLAEKTLTQLNQHALDTQQKLIDMSEQQLKALGTATQANQALVQEVVVTGMQKQAEATNTLLERFDQLGDQWVSQQNQKAEQFVATIGEQLVSLRDEESKRGDAAVERLNDMQAAVTNHLTTLGQALEEPMTRLIETASQTPKAAAQVIEKLRDEMSKNIERDNELLSERERLMSQLDGLSKTLETSSLDQREAITSLIESSAKTLNQVGTQFSQHVESESSKFSDVAEHFATSSVEMASLSDAFNAAVKLFSESNNQLIENLSRIETSLEKSNNRSDEQLGYYVAQAREIIDHNLLSHKEIIDALQQNAQPMTKQAGS